MATAQLLISLAALATAVALALGIASMMRGGRYDIEHAGQFMTARVVLQGATLLLLLIVLGAA